MTALPLYAGLSSLLKVLPCRSNINLYFRSHNIGTYRYISLLSVPTFRIKENFIRHDTFRYMAGHAKWQNIKHIKAEKDRQKSMLCNKFVRQVMAAVREKGPDPKVNNKLSHIMEEAKKNNIPSSTLEGALKKATTKKLSTGSIEMLGPGGCLVIFEYETDNLGEMRRMIKVICRKHGAGIYPGTSERWRAVYDKKGIIKVSKQLNGESLDTEKMLDSAIEAGAEDVKKAEEGEFYEFLCAPDDINMVKKELEEKFVIEEAYVGYLPTSTASLSDDDKSLALNFLNELAELPDVSRIYENVE